MGLDFIQILHGLPEETLAMFVQAICCVSFTASEILNQLNLFPRSWFFSGGITF